LIDRQDLDPEIFLEMEPTQATSSTAPLRLDCALTAQQPVNQDHLFYPAPTSSVEITLQAWQQIIDKAWEFGIPHILFTGGEPTLRDDLLALIQHAEQNGQVVGLVSDGFRMIEPAYFDEILRSGLDHVIQLIQPQNELAWQSLVKMEEADLFITAHLTITPSNKTQIKEALIKAASIGVNAFSLSSSDTSVLDTMLSMREIAANMDIPLVSGLPVPFAEMDLHSLEPEAAEKHPRSNWLYADPSGTLYLRPQDTTKIADLQNEVWPEIWERISRL
jgi:organic radical activating enzyme